MEWPKSKNNKMEELSQSYTITLPSSYAENIELFGLTYDKAPCESMSLIDKSPWSSINL